MNSPITPCGPEKVLMKPILSFCCCASAGAVSDTVTAAAMAVKWICARISSQENTRITQEPSLGYAL